MNGVQDLKFKLTPELYILPHHIPQMSLKSKASKPVCGSLLQPRGAYKWRCVILSVMNCLYPNMTAQGSREACDLCVQGWFLESVLFLASVSLFMLCGVSGIFPYYSWWIPLQIRPQLSLEAFLELSGTPSHLLPHPQRCLYSYRLCTCLVTAPTTLDFELQQSVCISVFP